LTREEKGKNEWNHSCPYYSAGSHLFRSSRPKSDYDELAEEFKGRGGAASKVFGLILLTAFFFGIFSILDLAATFWPQIKSFLIGFGVVDWITQNVAIILLFLLLVFGAALIAGVTVVRLAKNHGVGLVKFSIYALIVLPWVTIPLALVVIVLITGLPISLFFQDLSWLVGFLIVAVIMTVIGLVILHFMRDKMERAGMMIELSGQLLSEEKELLLPPVVMVILTLLTVVSAAAIGVNFYLRLVLPSSNPIVFEIALGVIEFLFLLLIIVITYSMDGINIAITHIWYRNRDPRFRDGRAIVWSRLGRIAKFGFLSALVETIISLFRGAAEKSKGATGIVYRAVGSIIGSIWYYVNYFTLPSIVLEDVPITESVKKSAKRFYHNFGDVLVREFGVGMVMGALKVLVAGIFALVGLFFSLLTGIQGPAIIAVVVVFMIASAIATFPLFRAMRVSYLTMLFTYIWDKETGFTKPSRMPAEAKKEIERWYQYDMPKIAAEEKGKRKEFNEQQT